MEKRRKDSSGKAGSPPRLHKLGTSFLYQVAEKLDSGSLCEERKRRGNLISFDFIMN
jgi:hypothetical protein